MATPTKKTSTQQIPTQQMLAFTWYREADYNLLLEASHNMKGLFEDYQAWLKDARAALQKYTDLGFEPQRIYIEVQDYLDWCELRQRVVNKPSREIFKEIKRQEFYRHLDAIDAGEKPESVLADADIEVLGFEEVDGKPD